MPRHGVVFSLAFLLAGCALDNNAWIVSKYKDSASFLFEPEAKPRTGDPHPDVKALVKSDIGTVFGRTEVKNVAVGRARPNGNNWTACIKADVAGITKRDIGTQYFVVEIDGGRIGLRRPATPAERCESEPFEPI